MRLLTSLLLAAMSLCGATMPYFSVLSDDPGAWPAILSSIGLQPKLPSPHYNLGNVLKELVA